MARAQWEDGEGPREFAPPWFASSLTDWLTLVRLTAALPDPVELVEVVVEHFALGAGRQDRRKAAQAPPGCFCSVFFFSVSLNPWTDGVAETLILDLKLIVELPIYASLKLKSLFYWWLEISSWYVDSKGKKRIWADLNSNPKGKELSYLAGHHFEALEVSFGNKMEPKLRCKQEL